MKALEFVTVLEDEKHIDIPSNLQQDVNKNQPVRVLILVNDDQADDKGWSVLSQKQFLNGYAQSDSIYDNE
jgi:hypothetical protein